MLQRDSLLRGRGHSPSEEIDGIQRTAPTIRLTGIRAHRAHEIERVRQRIYDPFEFALQGRRADMCEGPRFRGVQICGGKT